MHNNRLSAIVSANYFHGESHEFALPVLPFQFFRFISFRAAMPVWLLAFVLSWGVNPTSLQAQSNSRPGATDPIGNHLTLFPDDSLFGFSPEVQGDQINARLFPVSTTPNLSLPIPNVAIHLGQSVNPIYVASGRILKPDHEAVAVVQRNGASNAMRVDLLDPTQPAPPIVISLGDNSLVDRSVYDADTIAVAVGDLDKAVDTSGNFLDDIAVASLDVNNNILLNVYSYAVHDDLGNPTRYGGFQYGPAIPPSQSLVRGDNPLSVAIGDYDGDGKNEVAVTLISGSGISVTIFRYDSGQQMMSTVTSFTVPLPTRLLFANSVNSYYDVVPAATNSTKAADVNNDGRDELIVGSSLVGVNFLYGYTPVLITLGLSSSTLSPVSQHTFQFNTIEQKNHQVNFPKVEVATGQFLFDPVKIPFGTKQIAVAYDDSTANAGNGAIDVHLLTTSFDLSQVTEVGSPVSVTPDPAWPAVPNKQFWLAAGGFTGNSNPQSPTASLAIAAWTPWGNNGVYWIRTMAVSANGFSLAGLIDYLTPSPDSLLNAPVVATDWDGKSLYLGAPAHITLEHVVSTDYILEEPPKHSYWDNNAKQTVTISNYDSNSTGFTYAQGSSSSSTSTDHTNWTIGGSLEVSAGATVSLDEDVGIADTKNQASIDVTAKGSYEYNKNQSSYNSQYGSRKTTITANTDHDDYLQGRLELIDVWRYRIFGLTQTDTNTFYDIMLPAQGIDNTIPFSQGGLNFDWYQPVHENGNILTYPQKFNWSDTNYDYPADLGFYTDFDGTVKTEPLIPIQQFAFDGTSGSETLDLSSSRGTGKSVDYSNTLAESLDVKVSASAEAEVFGAGGEVRVSADMNFHNSNSWGKATTSDNTTTTDMTITLTKGSGDSSQAYLFEPVVYATQNGTFKMSYAVPNPGSPANYAGAGFWNGLYGNKPDPALNLPSRFAPTYAPNNVQNGWTPSLLTTRKQMRGLFFRKATVNTTTNDFDFLRNETTDGDTVRVEARVYNESTSQTAEGVTASFYTIPYDTGNNSEICPAPINGAPDDTGNLICPASARTLIGTANVPALGPLQYTCLSGTDDPAIAYCAPSVFINWDTKGFGPSTGTNSYRLYVVLTPGDGIGELYGSDGSPMAITGITGGSSVIVTTASPHNLHTGDYVMIGQSNAINGINGIYQVSWQSANSFSLNGRGANPGSYTAGGTATYFNPGQNDEGFGIFNVASTPPLQAVRGQELDDTLRKESVRAFDYHSNKLTAESVTAELDRPLRIRVAVFSSAQHPIGARLLLFDGDPGKGAPAIADQLVHPGSNGTNGTYVWFTWTPTTTGVHQIYAKLTAAQDSTKLGHKTASLQVNVLTPGDLNGDGKVDGADLLLLQSNIGQTALASSCGLAGDLDGDGLITVLDVRRLILICGAGGCNNQ